MNFNDYFYVDGGVLRWKIKNHRSKPGDAAGTILRNGYVQVKIKQKRYYAHRIVWMMHYGEIPVGFEIDHINHNRQDNRIENLRIVSRKQNRMNSSMYSNNSSGFNGVRWCNDRMKWIATIRANGKEKNLGRFDSFGDAVLARVRANISYGYHKNHGA